MQAQRVRAVRPRICTVCRRMIAAGDLYDKFTVTDEYGVVVRYKSCLNHEDDEDTDTHTRMIKRVEIGELKKMYPPLPEPAFERDAKERVPDPEQRIKGLDPAEAPQLPREIADLAMDIWLAGPQDGTPLEVASKLAVELHKRGWRKQ